MQKNSNDFSIEKAMDLANSPAGQQLLKLLQQTDADVLRQATGQATAGDIASLKQTLAPLLESDDVKNLLKQLGG